MTRISGNLPPKGNTNVNNAGVFPRELSSMSELTDGVTPYLLSANRRNGISLAKDPGEDPWQGYFRAARAEKRLAGDATNIVASHTFRMIERNESSVPHNKPAISRKKF